MEKTYTTLIFPLILLMLTSCSVEAVRENVNKEGEYGFSFRESKQEWDKLKAKNNNSYTYTILEESFTGFGSETTILVRRGKVVERHYEAFEISEENGTKTVTYSYSEENARELGQHPEGAEPLTMDQLYRSCVAQYLIADSGTNEIYFETNEEGVMMLCGFVPHGCQDDCYRGITISEFAWL